MTVKATLVYGKGANRWHAVDLEIRCDWCGILGGRCATEHNGGELTDVYPPEGWDLDGTDWSGKPGQHLCPHCAQNRQNRTERAVREAIHAETNGQDLTFHPGGQDLAKLIAVAVEAALRVQKEAGGR